MRRLLCLLLLLVTTLAAQEGGGFRFTVTDGAPPTESRGARKPVSGAPLSPAATQALLGRLKPLKAREGDTRSFALRERSLPPPKTGTTVKQPFPPPPSTATPDPVAQGPLKVLRHAPEGEVELAPHLSVTFSQPMVPVTTVAQVQAENVPVRLTPQPKGRWRWVGTQTLLFEPEGRFPMATQYQVEVPAGTASATGGQLAEAVRWSFGTPPPRLVASYPPNGTPQPLRPTLFLAFDQAVDPQMVLKHLTITPQVPLRLTEPTSEVAKMADRSVQGRYVALALEQPLSSGTSYRVTLPPGFLGTEGPRPTTAELTYQFRTYDPLKVMQTTPDPRPGQSLWVRFNNPLDEDKFRDAQVRVTPAIPDLVVEARGNLLSLRGRTRGRTAYSVTVDGSLADRFGQTLGAPAHLPFNVGPAHPSFALEGGAFQVLEIPRLNFVTTNKKTVRVEVRQVKPEEFDSFRKWWGETQRNIQDPPDPPGQEILTKTLTLAEQPDERVETPFDLPLPKGHMLVIAEPDQDTPKNGRRQRAIAWVQVTSIGLDAFLDGPRLIGWATALKDGSPLAQVQLQAWPGGGNATTDAQGFATLEAGPSTMLLARRGDDVAMLPANANLWSSASWPVRSRADRLAWYVTDDRKMYRPGEKVHVKGWVRKIQAGPQGDVSAAGVRTLSYTVQDSRGNKIHEGQAQPGALGGFDMVFELPKTVNLGQVVMRFTTEGGQTAHTFQVQEFRRPEFEVKAQANQSASFVGEPSTVTVSATYYAGGGLPDAPAEWTVSSSPGSYAPPGWTEYTFGKWVPWWDYRGWWEDDRREARYPSQTFSGRTDAAGNHTIKLDFESVEPPRPVSVTAQARVTDVNRQAWAGTAPLLVHPADVYVGLKPERAFVQKGQALPLKLVVTDLDGQPVANRSVTVKAYRLDWKRTGSKLETIERDVQTRTETSSGQPLSVTIPTGEGGTYQVEALVTDGKGRRNSSQLTMWVAGGAVPPARKVSQEKVTLVPDRPEYAAGDVAEVLVQAPFAPAQGVLTTRREGLVERRTFALPEGSATLKIPIEKHFTPNLNVQVDVVGSAPRTLANGEPVPGAPPRPAYAMGALSLAIPPKDRALSVKLSAPKALQPGATTDVSVVMLDAAGQPVVGGEVALLVVDESILSLTGFRFADPLGSFYPHRAGDVSDYHLRQYVTLASTDDLRKDAEKKERDNLGVGSDEAPDDSSVRGMLAAPKARSPVAQEEGRAAPAPPIAVRADFNPLALFAPAVRTGAGGKAVVGLKLPDNLTRYRIVALAAAGDRQFGKGESSLTARLPLMVRPSAPRFLNFGDRCELPVVVQNQTDKPMEVEVAVRASNAKLLEGAGRKVTVPANNRVELRFPVTTVEPGTARFQLAAASAQGSDAAEISLPVWTPATTEAYATYGTINEGSVVQPVKAPEDVFTEFGGLEVTTTSTAVAELTDAFLYLQSYPFECAEQLASRILSVAALRDVLQAFQAPGRATPAEIEAAMKRDLERLRSQQNNDGGWDWWVRGKPSDPFVSLHVAHALARARQKGYAVHATMLTNSQGYLESIERHIPDWYPESCKRALRAYALYVLRLLGEPDVAKAKALLAEVKLESHPLETLGWLLPILSQQPEAAAIRTHLANRVSETASTAQFSGSYGDGNYLLLYSDRRCDAILLEALLEDQPTNDVIPKLVRGLLDHRVAGRWGNTQENCFVLLALDKYFDVYEKITPDFVARVWLGDGLAGEQAFKGRSTAKNQLDIPMSMVTGAPLTLTKTGPGRLYYRIGLSYAPKNLKLAPSEQGFSVTRTYEAVKDNRDVSRDADGTWHIKAGAEVRVRLQMVANSRRYHVALVDPLPAGLEPLNPALAVTGSLPKDPLKAQPTGRGRYWWWFSTWFQHQNLRDERVEAFTTLLWEGVHPYTYVARATTPGVFVVPPAKAEEMYHPETFGRSGSDRVVVE